MGRDFTHSHTLFTSVCELNKADPNRNNKGLQIINGSVMHDES